MIHGMLASLCPTMEMTIDYINESLNPKEVSAFSVGNFFFDISEIEAVQGWDILGAAFKRQHRDTVTRCAEG